MNDDFDRIWSGRAFTFDPGRPLEQQVPCEHAADFQAWVDALFAGQLGRADVIRLNQLKILVQDRFLQVRARLRGEHLDDDRQKYGHPCVFSVFEAAVGDIRERELALAPPEILTLSPKAVEEPRIDYPGVLFGDKDPEFGP